MSDLYQGLGPALTVAPPLPAPPPGPVRPTSDLYEGLGAPLTAPAVAPARPASGFVESVQAGFQGSAPGLLWRRKLPDLFVDHTTAKWWESALSSLTQIGSELPIMVPAAMGGAALAGGPVNPVGSLLSAGFAMGAVPATIRQSLIESYKSGEIKTAAEWFEAVKNVAKAAGTEGGINAAAMGAGALAKAGLATARGATAEAAKAIGVGTATPLTRGAAVGSEALDLTTQVAAMVTLPAAAEGRLPTMQEFIHGAIVVGGLKGAHVTAKRMMDVYEKTGRTPLEQVADARADPKTAAELAETTGTTSGVPVKLDRLIAEAETLARGGLDEAPKVGDLIRDAKVAPEAPAAGALPIDKLVAEAEYLGRGPIPEAPRIRDLLVDLKRKGPLQVDVTDDIESMVAAVKRLDEIEARREQAPEPMPGAAAETAAPARQPAPAATAPRPTHDEIMAHKRAANELASAEETRTGAPAHERMTRWQEKANEAGKPLYLKANPKGGWSLEPTPVSEAGAAKGWKDVATFYPDGVEPSSPTKPRRRALTKDEKAERDTLRERVAELEEKVARTPTMAEFDASTRRVYDDVVGRLRAQAEERAENGLPPIYDKPPEAIARVITTNARTFAQDNRVLPWDIYSEFMPTFTDASRLTPKEIAARVSEEAGTIDVNILKQPAYHGTPHTIGPEGFKLDRIGTGEGAQAYGWGLYFAENPKVAQEYQRNVKAPTSVPPRRTFKGEELEPGSAPYHAGTLLATMGRSLAGVRKEVRGWIDNAKPGEDVEHYKAVLETLNKANGKKDFKELVPKSNLYQVDIPDQQVAKMLDWDKPLSSQPEILAKLRDSDNVALRQAYEDSIDKTHPNFDQTGDALYERLQFALDDDPQAASLALSAAGIPGIKYLDQGSRANFSIKESRAGDKEVFVVLNNSGDPVAQRNTQREALDYIYDKSTRNIVVFDDSIVKVTHKNGEPLTPQERAEYFQTAETAMAQKNAEIHRAAYQVNARLISTFETADASSIPHELGHHFLEMLRHFATKGGASARSMEMWSEAKREFAIPDEGPIPTASHETWAKMWERYLGEGEAPTPGLKAMFDQFKEWMLSVYQDVRNIIGVDIKPEVRRLFDRMLATDEEIKAAREMNVPRAYVNEAKANETAKVVTEKKQPGFIDEQLAVEPFAEELVMGPGSGPGRDSRANPKFINSPMDVKLAIAKLAEVDQANIQARRGGQDGVETWKDTDAKIDKMIEDTLGGDGAPMNLFVADPNAPPVNVQMRAAFRVMVSMAKHSITLRDNVLKKGHDATVQEQWDYLNSVLRMRMAHAEYLGQRAGVARAMNQIRDMTPESGAVDRMVEATSGDQTLFQSAKSPAEQAAELKTKLDALMAQHFSGKTALEVAARHAQVKTLKQQLKFAEAAVEATSWDKFIELWKNGLLSGPQTPVTNVIATWSFQALQVPIDAVAAGVGMLRGAKVGEGATDRASAAEGMARVTGMLSGVRAGIKAASATFRADEATEKVEAFRNAIPGRFGEVVRFSFRLMGAGDAFISTMYRYGELKTLAVRRAVAEGHNPLTREFAERVQHWIDNPTERMTTEADAAALRMTFNTESGERLRAVQTFVKQWHLEWMVPFIRTPARIAEEMIRMSPAAPMIDAWRADIAKGGAARDRAIAEVVVGSGIMALTMAYAFEGSITGSGSPDPGKRRSKEGIEQPNSIKVGNTWYEIGRLQPGGTLMVLAADVAATWDMMNDEQRDKIPKMLALAFSNAITNQTFLQGLTNVIHMMSEPDRYGSRFFQGLAGSMVPNIIGQPTAMMDPKQREINSMADAIRARLPGAREGLLPKVDWLGEDKPARERLGVVLPVRTLEPSKDKVREEAARLEISLAAAPKKTHIGKGTGKLGDVELTPEERNKFAEVGGKMAHQILTSIVNAPGYDQVPDLIKKQMFARVLTASHRVAAVQALPLEKRLEYLKSITERVAQELATQ